MNIFKKAAFVALSTFAFTMVSCSSDSSSGSSTDPDSSSSVEISSSSVVEQSSSSAEATSSSSSVIEQSSSSVETPVSSSSSEEPPLSSSSETEQSSSSVAGEPSKDTFTDARDEQIYEYVTIGTQVWMAENLNYDTLDGTGSWCYDDNDPTNCATYGRLYNWATAVNLNDSCNTKDCSDQVQTVHQGICPAGWHLPSDAEWTTLTVFVQNDLEIDANNIGTALKADRVLWSTNTGTDNYGFSALPGGGRNIIGQFYSVGSNGYWWIASENNSGSAYYRYMGSNLADVGRSNSGKTEGFSVRCVKDSEPQ